MKTFFQNLNTALLAVVILCTNALYAQELEINWGKKFDVGNDYLIQKPIGVFNNRIYYQSSKSKFIEDNKVAISTIDVKSLNFQGNAMPSVQEKKSTFVSVAIGKQNMWLIARSPNKVDKTERITAYKLNNKGETEPKSYLMAEFKNEAGVNIEWIGTYAYVNKKTAGCTILTSNDSTKIALLINVEGGKKTNERFYLKVLNSNDLTTVWEQAITLPFTEKRYQLKDYTLNNEGEIIITGKVYNNDNEKEYNSKTEIADYKYITHTFDGKDEKGKPYEWKLGGKFVASSFIKTRRDNGNTIFAAAYTKEHGKTDPATMFYIDGDIEGFYGFEIEVKTGKIINDFRQNVSADKVKNITTACFDKKTQALDNSLIIKNLYAQKEGALVIVTAMSSYSKFDGMRSYLDDAIFCFDNDRKLKWATAVPKKLSVPTGYGLGGGMTMSGGYNIKGSVSLFKNDALFLIYHDSDKNIEKEIDGKAAGSVASTSSVLAVAKVDKDGNLSRKTIITVKDLEGAYIVNDQSFQITDDELILTAEANTTSVTNKNKIGRARIK